MEFSKMESIKLFYLYGTFFCILTVVNAYLVPNYCCLKCGSRHVMCKYKKSGIREHCKHISKISLTSREKLAALTTLNTVRSDAALGRYDDLKAFARNMRKLEWDDELEMMAVRWAEQCGPPNTQDPCRDTIFYSVGQVVYFEYGQNPIERMVRGAYRHQKCKFLKHPYHITDYCLPNLNFPGWNVQNYAQGALYENYKVGCALQQTNHFTQLICNFAPGIITRDKEIAMFTRLRDQICDSCPNNTECHAPFPGLCTFTNEASTLQCRYFTSFLIFIGISKMWLI
ncbi:hypothetical protein O3M35_009547 [Rhynocoris fuscipes]|uniref:SCP domain-containing protein n=1 Tax=Rhynocoris fuscipes TaxID=488301 RepID=A0AAW1D3B3_9HEMI